MSLIWGETVNPTGQLSIAQQNTYVCRPFKFLINLTKKNRIIIT